MDTNAVNAVIDRNPFAPLESGVVSGFEHPCHCAVAEIFGELPVGKTEEIVPFGAGTDESAFGLQKELIRFQVRGDPFSFLKFRFSGCGECNGILFHDFIASDWLGDVFAFL